MTSMGQGNVYVNKFTLAYKHLCCNVTSTISEREKPFRQIKGKIRRISFEITFGIFKFYILDRMDILYIFTFDRGT